MSIRPRLGALPSQLYMKKVLQVGDFSATRGGVASLGSIPTSRNAEHFALWKSQARAWLANEASGNPFPRS
jgi:hypothetical protein